MGGTFKRKWEDGDSRKCFGRIGCSGGGGVCFDDMTKAALVGEEEYSGRHG